MLGSQVFLQQWVERGLELDSCQGFHMGRSQVLIVHHVEMRELGARGGELEKCQNLEGNWEERIHQIGQGRGPGCLFFGGDEL
jgi:hypothetical protein